MRLRYSFFLMSFVGAISLITVGCSQSQSSKTGTQNKESSPNNNVVAYYVIGTVGSVIKNSNNVDEIQINVEKAATAKNKSNSIPFRTSSNSYNLIVKMNDPVISKDSAPTVYDKIVAKVWKTDSSWVSNNKNLFMFQNGFYYNSNDNKLDVDKLHWKSVVTTPGQ